MGLVVQWVVLSLKCGYNRQSLRWATCNFRWGAWWLLATLGGNNGLGRFEFAFFFFFLFFFLFFMIEKFGFVLEYNYACLIFFFFLDFTFTSIGFFFKLGFSVYFEDLHWFARKTGKKRREKHG